MTKDYDYLLKVLLVGDSDVGKHEILSGLEDASSESPFCSGNGNVIYDKKTFLIFTINSFKLQHIKQQLYSWKEKGLNYSCGILRVKVVSVR